MENYPAKSEIKRLQLKDQQIRYFNPGHLNNFIFLVEFLLQNIGNLMETVAAVLVASVSKITSGREADVTT